jgi:hypothetical protein
LPKLLFNVFTQNPEHKVPDRMLFGFKQDIVVLDVQMSELAKRAGARYISPYAVMCDARGCLTKLGDTSDTLTAWDVGHFTRKSSQYVVSKFPRPNFAPGNP